MIRILFGLESLFSLWMLVDAVQRGAARYWYPIIFLPFGQVAYFFTVKIHDPEFRAMRGLFQAWTKPKITLEQLRYRATETPSFVNKLALAQGLVDAGSYQEAATSFEELLTADDESKDALYGYAACQLELTAYDRAIVALQRLIEIKASFREYEAWANLAYALWKTDQLEVALEVLGDLVRKAPRLDHRVMYAGYLSKDRKFDEARTQLQLALQDHEHAPRFQRKQDYAAAKKARAMLAQLEPG